MKQDANRNLTSKQELEIKLIELQIKKVELEIAIVNVEMQQDANGNLTN